METLLTTAKKCEIRIRRDGATIWVNSEEGCICRVQGIEQISVVDEREPMKRIMDINYPTSTQCSK